MTHKPLIYIAQAYSYNPVRAWADVIRIAGYLTIHGFYPFSPILQNHLPASMIPAMHGLKQEFWYGFDLAFLARCDEMWVYRDRDSAWRDSKGVELEREFCRTHFIPTRDFYMGSFAGSEHPFDANRHAIIDSSSVVPKATQVK